MKRGKCIHRESANCVESAALVALLKACSKSNDLHKGITVHADILKRRLLGNPFIATALIDMYAKCGALEKASEVLDALPFRNVVSWNALVAGYVQKAHGEAALSCFEQIQNEGLVPDAVTFTCILKACGSMGEHERGRNVHFKIIRQVLLDDNVILGNALVDMYARCGLLGEAVEMLESLPIRDVISWNALITGYVQGQNGQEAMNCFKQMQFEGLKPNVVTFICILQACDSIRVLDKGKELHFEVVKQGLLSGSAALGGSLVDMYAKCGALMEAKMVFESLPYRDVALWNSLILGYVNSEKIEEALICFQLMLCDGFSPNAVTYMCILKACSSIRALDMGEATYFDILNQGLLGRNVVVASAVVDMFVKCGAIAKAEEVFEKILVRNVISWNALIAGYVEEEQIRKALDCFQRMQCEGLFPDAATFACILQACGNLGALGMAKDIHSAVISHGLLCGHAVLGGALVDMYAKCNALIKAKEVLEELLIRDVVSWSALIAGYVQAEHNEEALMCLELMHWEGLSSNLVILSCILTACGNLGALDMGKCIHSEIVRQGWLNGSVLLHNLIDMYVKCGALFEAREVLKRHVICDNVSWSTLIKGYVQAGHGAEALDCFDLMQCKGVLPDIVTLTWILRACGSIGALSKGETIHTDIIRLGLVRENTVLDVALVDMYVKCGSLLDAKVFKGFPVKDFTSWNGLIAGNEQGEHMDEVCNCFDLMQWEGEFPDAATSVCVLNVCCRMGVVDKGENAHIEIMRRLLCKNPVFCNGLMDRYDKCDALLRVKKVLEMFSLVDDVAPSSTFTMGYAQRRNGREELSIFGQMYYEAMFPNAGAFVWIWKACGSIQALDNRETIDSKIVSHGLLDGSILLGNALVDMYAKCGALGRARIVFDALPVRTVVSWCDLIVGYAQEHAREAVILYEHMQLEGLFPDEITLTCLLKACGRIRAIDKGRIVHTDIVKQGLLGGNIILGGALVDMYAKCGALTKVKEVLEELPVRDVVSWSALITGHVQGERIQEALNYFEQMQCEGVAPNMVTFICILKVYGSIRAVDKGEVVHCEIIRQGLLDGNVALGNALVDMYAKCGALVKASEVFEGLLVQDIISWSSLIRGYVQEEHGKEALNYFQRMQFEGFSPDAGTFICILKACGSIGALARGQDIHLEIVRQGVIDSRTALGNALIDMYANCGALSKAKEVLEGLPVCDVVSWSALITGCVQEEQYKEALNCFQQMQNEGISPDEITFVCVLNACSHLGALDEGQSIFMQMITDHGITPCVEHVTSMINLLGQVGFLNHAVLVIKKMTPFYDPPVWRALLTACKKFGNVTLGKWAFHTQYRWM